ncbi:class I SAM-dependent methyltransferase [Vibrio quintilis]|uniref:Ribosomal RNA large subunit methyltransferase I n=1 Tax=Vibrio quintilis TaxID=1117707 RepID=A0A1M7YUP5_9VIBR|nr:class I SAM-dependent methyltransferase [Vibrio quintilis]SHO56390.1 Ribosomal RNA large subunit methyltransferase I [Vibrio quintilis]
MDLNQLTTFIQHIETQLASSPVSVKRLFHGRGRRWPGLEQLTADWLANQLIISLFKQPEPLFIRALEAELTSLTQRENWRNTGATCIAIQHRYQTNQQLEVIWGTLEEKPVVDEHGLKFQLDIGKNQNFGLFPDMSEGRQWVQQHATGKHVLNLFAYTCGFSVAAIAGGAERVVNVDMAKASLSKGRENHKLNQHDLSRVQFMGHDIFKSWGKIRKSGPYDLIVIDPPSFQKGSFALTRDYRKILRRMNELLADQGSVLACVNSPVVDCNFLIETMKEEAPFINFQQRLDNPPEFEDIDPQASLKALVFR